MILAHDIIEGILLREGTTYTDRPADRGGPTCCGVTLATLQAYHAPAPVTVEDLKHLDPPGARQVYQYVFIEAPGFSRIRDANLQALIVDAGVQHGVDEAAKMVQRAAGVTADGHLGAISLAAINSYDAHALRVLVCAARIRLYGALVSHDPELARARLAGYHLQADNALGWANRIAQFVEVFP